MPAMQDLFSMQGTMFLLMLLGILFRRRGVVGEGFCQDLTEVIIRLILPCNIVSSFCVSFTVELLRQTAVIFLISIAVQLGCWLLAVVLYRHAAADQKPSLQYATLCSNAGFLGNAVAESLFGSQGLLLTSVYLIPQRVVMWTLGLSFFTSDPDHRTDWKKMLRHPCIVAVGIGMVLLVSQWQLPSVLLRTVKSLGGCNTAMSMFMIGMLISDFPWKYFKNRGVLLFSAVRLGLIPLLVLGLCRLCGVTGLTLSISVVLAAMPAGATTAIIAAKQHCNAEFAAGCVTVSTTLSMLAIPVWCGLVSML